MAHIGKQYAVRGLNKKGEGLIQIYVNFSRTKRKVISTGIYIEPRYWNKKRLQVVYHPLVLEYNKKIDDMIIRLMRLELWCKENVVEFNSEFIDDSLKQNHSIKLFNEFYESELKLDNLAPGTFKDQYKTLNHLNDFRPNILFGELNHSLIQKFDTYLRNLGHAPSTLWGHHKNLKKYINKAILNGYLPENQSRHPYGAFIQKKPKPDRLYLQWESVLKIYQTEYPTDRLRRVADRFVFACCTGLRISDLSRVTPEKFNGVNLVMKPEKTSHTSGATVNLPIRVLFEGLPFKILHKYDYTLPTFADADYNQLLKVVANRAKVPPLTSHVARHSFLTMIALYTGNMFSVMDLGGITSSDTAMIYVHIAECFSGNILKSVEWPKQIK